MSDRPWQPQTLAGCAYYDALLSVESGLHLCLRSTIQARNTADRLPSYAPAYLEQVAEAQRLIAKAARLLNGLPGVR
jgi:hypothetical protein